MEEQALEYQYRHGYCDGFADGIRLLHRLMNVGRVRRNRTTEAMYIRCDSFWLQKLIPWATKDTDTIVNPPRFEGFEEKKV